MLSCDGQSVYMRHTRFDLEGQPQTPDVPHLFSSAGFLDDSWWHRTYWQWGTKMQDNYGGWLVAGTRVPAGRILSVDGQTVYGFGRNQYVHTGAHIGIDAATTFHYKPDQDADHRFTNYQAFAIDAPKPVEAAKPPTAKPAKKQPPANQPPVKQPATKAPAVPPKKYHWTQPLPIVARAMVLAPNSMFLAGPPDLLASDDPTAALQGKKGGLLCVVARADGKKLAQYELESPPVFDGMAAAGGRLYMATLDGRIVCFSGEK